MDEVSTRDNEDIDSNVMCYVAVCICEWFFLLPKNTQHNYLYFSKLCYKEKLTKITTFILL